MTRNIPSRATRAAAITVLIAALSAGASALNTTVLTGLDSPRGLAVGPGGRVIYAEGPEGGDGLISELIANGKNAGTTNLLNSVPGTYIAPNVAALGGQIFVLTAGGEPGSGSNTLYRVTNGKVQALADIAAYQVTDPDPYNLADPVDESNPFGLAPLPDGSVLVSDAAANDLLRVYPNGKVVTVARLKPRLIPWPAGLPVGPPAGTMVPSEDVATSVAVGADGYYYVGELRGFPATPGHSQVWRIAPDSVNAVCDPVNPNVGACRRYADGFTSIVDLEGGPDGSIYVVQLSNASWARSPVGPFPAAGGDVGSVWRLAPGGGSRSELAAGQLHLPAGVAVTSDNAVYVTSPVFGPGAITRVQ
jgi:glucose/arabinose dehydrogenase